MINRPLSPYPSANRAPAVPLLAALSERQFLHPHQRLRSALLDLAVARRLPMRAIDQSLRLQQLDSQLALGRLRQVDLAGLAACIDRCRRQLRVRPCTA